MRLLKILSNGDIRLTEKPFDDDIPSYAILWHTWGNEEVTFRDMVNDSGRTKIRYEKIKFCRDQAARDGLQYFWVDSCCIDKSNVVMDDDDGLIYSGATEYMYICARC